MIYGSERESISAKLKERGEDGVPLYRQTVSDYAKRRRDELAQERKLFNVDHLERYRGGLPQKENGRKRGQALGNIGEFHSPRVHNNQTQHTFTSQHIGPQEAFEYKMFTAGKLSFKAKLN